MSSKFSTNNARLSVNRNPGNENRPTGIRKSKIENNENKTTRGSSIGVQRAPLGAIHSNVHGMPKRAPSKQECTIENSKTTKPFNGKLPTVPSRQPFMVHHDDEEQKENKTLVGNNIATVEASYSKNSELTTAESQLEITASVRQPFKTLNLNHGTLKESPMILDLSISLDSSSKASIPVTPPACQIREDLLVPQYSDDIYAYLRELEVRCQPKPNYMKKQPDITNGMRSILVDWLVEVAEEYKLQTETLYLAVTYIDRFLSCMSVLRGKLQLVGTASMFIASKFEEIYPPEVEEFVYITDDTYTKKQVLRMEQIILRVLAFDLTVPTVYYFLQHFFHEGKLDEKTQNLALYLGELTLLEADPYLQFLPSIIASSAICLARHTLDQHCWSKELKVGTGYSIEDFKDCLKHMYKSFTNAGNYPQQAVREKYSSGKYSEVGKVLPPVMQPI